MSRRSSRASSVSDQSRMAPAHLVERLAGPLPCDAELLHPRVASVNGPMAMIIARASRR